MRGGLRRIACLGAAAVALAPLSQLLGGCGTRGPSPALTSVSPAIATNAAAVTLTLTGSDFAPMPAGVAGAAGVRLPRVFLLGSAGAPIELPASFESTTVLKATVPAGIAIGPYGVRVLNPDGRAGSLADAFHVVLPDTITVSSITPNRGWTGATTEVVVNGIGFLSTPRVELYSGATVIAALQSVAFLDSRTLQAIVPAGVATGTYDVKVTNPAGEVGTLAAGFIVGTDAPPTIVSIVPDRGPVSLTNVVTVTGSHLPPDVQVALIDSAGALTPAVVNYVTGSSSMNVTVPASLGIGTYQLRAIRPADGVHADHAPYTVISPGGVPGPWLVDGSALEPRRSQGLVVAQDDLGQAWLYQVGGESITSTSALTTFDSVTAAPLDDFGHPGAWRVDSSHLSGPRSAAAVWTFGGYLFAAGGKDATPAILSTIERAKVLRAAGAPRDLTAVAGAAGTLDAGTWYYRVSAVVSDADDPGGETRPSGFAAVTLPGAGAVHLSWSAPAEGNATSYDVYRTPAVNGALGQERLLATGVSGVSFDDDGSLTVSSAQVPKPAGSLGAWVTLSTGLTTPRSDAGVAVARLPAAGGGYGGTAVYVIGGAGSTVATAAPLATYEYSLLSSSGAISFTADATHLLAAARMRPGTGVGDATTAPGAITAGSSFVYVEGGLDPSQSGNAKYPRSVEAGTVALDGSLTWQTAFLNGIRGSGPVGVMVGDDLWLLGGESTLGVSASVSTGAVNPASPPALLGMTNTNQPLPSPRTRAGGTIFRGHIYVVGGSADGTGTVRSVFEAVY